MADLDIAPLGDGHFRVRLTEGGSTSTHDVKVPAESMQRLGWPGTPEELLRRAFHFLLEREPKESILSSFDIDAIGRYFPEWEETARGGFA
ncbi:MAG: hypothetical protein ACRDJ4_02170 [Actinomycetota bacterium]